MSSPSIAAVPAVTERNRYVDFLRVASIAVVVLGHWLMAVIAWEGGRIVGGHLLAEAPRLQLLTWVFQVMPVFFIVGGYANAASWSSAERRGVGYGAWMRARAARLLRPTAVFVAVWTALALVVRLAPIDPELVQAGSRLVAVPLWFLAVYFLVIPAVPVMLTAHGRFGVWVPVVLTAAAAAVDLASWGFELPLIGWANFALVWLAVHQLGFLWRDGLLTERGQIPWLLAGGGLAALALLVWLGPYPLSMVGVEGAARTNNAPPSVPLVALAVWQAGLMLLFEDRGNAWLARERPWAAAVTANSMVMTVYLWHLTALALATLALFPTELWPRVAPLSPVWWALRPLWVLVLALVLVPLVLLFWRVERSTMVAGRTRPLPLGTMGALLGAGGVVAGLALLALRGFLVPESPGGLPLLALAFLVPGLALLGVMSLRPATASAL